MALIGEAFDHSGETTVCLESEDMVGSAFESRDSLGKQLRKKTGTTGVQHLILVPTASIALFARCWQPGLLSLQFSCPGVEACKVF